MTESDAKSAKLSAEWWKSKKPKSITDLKLESALKAYESMAKADEYQSQLTQLGILLTCLDEVKKLCKPEKDKEHKYVLHAMLTMHQLVTNEGVQVKLKIKKWEEDRQKLERELGAFVEKTGGVIQTYASKLSKHYQLLKLALEKQMSMKFSQIDASVNLVFEYEAAIKISMTEFNSLSHSWTRRYGELKGQNKDTALAKWKNDPKVKEVLLAKQEFDAHVQWVRDKAKDVRGACGVAG